MNRVVLVTGGVKGIGRVVASEFVECGDVVVVNYSKSSQEALSMRDEFKSAGKEIFLEQADVSDYDGVKGMTDRVINRFGKIDVLVNNAGIVRDGLLMLMPQNDWNDVIAVNLTGVFNCSKAVSECMITQRGGAIVNIASLSGISGLEGQVNYSAAKGGVIAFTKSLAKELARFGVRVNAVAPGVIETEMAETVSEKHRSKFLQAIPMSRFGKAKEVSSVVRFLASEDASYITGEVITVSGGLY